MTRWMRIEWVSDWIKFNLKKTRLYCCTPNRWLSFNDSLRETEKRIKQQREDRTVNESLWVKRERRKGIPTISFIVSRAPRVWRFSSSYQRRRQRRREIDENWLDFLNAEFPMNLLLCIFDYCPAFFSLSHTLSSIHSNVCLQLIPEILSISTDCRNKN